ncbi:MAG: glycoside hydrolase family 3 C-terminal domain-containing protein [Anaerolineaceae bacterium]
MSDLRLKAREIVNQLTLEEKASLCSGADTWHTKAIERVGLSSVMMADGPHGLRVTHDQGALIGARSEPATCFPPACATGSSFDRGLLRRVGEAIAREAQAQELAVVLGPGVNIKRHPLCGRNFEYFSEDPFVAGELGSAFVDGVQAGGIGTSLKHFAANNQERGRLTNDSEIDQRALHEIYLAAFETIVKKAQPWTVMCCYNKVNGTYGSQNHWLLTDKLRKDWGFEGFVVSDWGAVSDRVAGVDAGLDLEMPFVGEHNDQWVLKAVKNGELDPAKLDQTALRVVELALKHLANTQEVALHLDQQHAMAREAAAGSAVLLKNEAELLPLRPLQTVAVIGQFAEKPRYQGAGSSQINPHQIDTPLQALQDAGFRVSYANGYDHGSNSINEDLIIESEKLAAQSDVALVFAGLPDSYESEGFDRKDMKMPAAHNTLISRIAAANPNTVVVLMCGAPVELPWRDEVKAILLMYLGGQAVGQACADLLSGAVCPSGKLAETWPRILEDTPAFYNFGDPYVSQYRESVFIGYRWYDTANRAVAYPFGHGLSYTQFEIGNLQVNVQPDDITVFVSVTNTGRVPGAEVVQLYVGAKSSAIYRAEKELKAFEKIFLQPGESKQVEFKLKSRDFAYYDVGLEDWNVEPGTYMISIGGSSRNITCKTEISPAFAGQRPSEKACSFADSYRDLPINDALNISEEDFATIWSGEVAEHKVWPFTIDSPIKDLKYSWIGRIILNILKKQAEKFVIIDNNQVTGHEDIYEYPLRFISMQSSLDLGKIKSLVKLLNFPIFRGKA